MTAEELRYVVLVQAKELRASRKTIERQERRLRELNYELQRAEARNPTDAETIRDAYRRGYRTGWTVGRRGEPQAAEPERASKGWMREIAGSAT